MLSRTKADISKYFLQIGAGYCGNMLKHVAPWHQSYALKYNMAYVPHYGTFACRTVGRFERRLEWQKLPFILHWMNHASADALFVYLDTDAVIVRPEIDLSDVLPSDCDMAMCRASYAGSEFYNCGVILFRNNRATRDLFQQADEMGPGIGLHAHDEGRINKLIRDGHEVKIYDLPGEYNACNYTQFDPTRVVVKAWHGIPRDTAERRVQETVCQLQKPTF